MAGDDESVRDQRWIAARYRVISELAIGGSGIVYRVLDAREGVELALKSLRAEKADARSAQLFRDEYRTLCQLTHPRIVSVFDYGVCDTGAYYTMELLDGLDVREAAPLPVADVCGLLRDVASALAMMHTRRLLHRDVSYRNVRCTASGCAKLIDFGAMMPIGVAAEVIGTAPFIPPEALHGHTLEPRSDLYSLGALAYWMLTARHAYPANNLQTLQRLWTTTPPQPVSSYIADIPAELNRLVMAMLSQDPHARPGSAAEVMDRLGAIANLPPAEDLRVAEAYLAKPALVGRERERQRIREFLEQADLGFGRGPLVLEGAEGAGKTRMLEELVIEARLAGFVPIKPRGGNSREPYVLVRDLLEQVLPNLTEGVAVVEEADRQLLASHFPQFGAAGSGAVALSLGELRSRLQGALTRFFVRAGQRVRLCIAVDDFQCVDEESGALIAALAAETSAVQPRLALTLPLAQAGEEPALRLVRQLGSSVRLHKLLQAEVGQLIDSLFGDVPNAGRVAHWMFERTRGNPLECVELAHYLVACEAIIYTEGTWMLPASLPREVPEGLEQTRRARIAALPADQRKLAEAAAVFEARLSLELCAEMSGVSAGSAARGLEALVRLEVLRKQAGDYVFVAEALRAQFEQELSRQHAQALHERAGQLLLARGALDFHTELRAAHHLMRGVSPRMGADRIAALARNPAIPRDISEAFTVPLELALAIYRAEGASPAERAPLLMRLTNATFLYDYQLVHYGVELLSQLWQDAGLDLLGESETSEPNWLPGLLARAALRQRTIDVAERGLPPAEALANLSSASVLVLAATVLKYDIPRIVALWEMVEPIAQLGSGNMLSAAPELVGIALRGLQVGETAVHELRLDYIARMRDLSQFPGFPEARRLSVVATQLHHIGMAISVLDSDAAMRLADEIDALGLEMYRGAAEQVRFTVFMYRGELELAERCRARLDVLALQGGAGTQFELWLAPYVADPYALWDDALGLKRAAAQLKRLAAAEVGYAPFASIATGHHYRVRGEYGNALDAFTRALALAPRDRHSSWLLATSGYIDTLVEAGQFEPALALGLELLDSLAYTERYTTFIRQRMACSLALAEAHLGQSERALERCRRALELELSLGKSPLNLGRLHETMARIAIEQGDGPSFSQHLLRAREYFAATHNPALIKRRDRLTALGRSQFPAAAEITSQDDLYAYNALQSLGELKVPSERATRALSLILREVDAEDGYLFLTRGPQLELSAATMDRPPPLGLHGMLSEFISQMFEETEYTVTLSPAARGGVGTTTLLCDQQEYAPLPLMITVDGGRELVGIIAIPVGTSSSLQLVPSRLIDAITAHLYAASTAPQTAPH